MRMGKMSHHGSNFMQVKISYTAVLVLSSEFSIREPECEVAGNLEWPQSSTQSYSSIQKHAHIK